MVSTSKSKKKKFLRTLNINSKKVLKKRYKKKTNFIGSGIDLIFGLIYLSKKYKNLDIPFKFKKSYGYKRNDFMNYGIRFDCNYFDNVQKLILPLIETKFFDLIKKSKKRFLAIFVYIKWDCKSNSAHFNSLLFDTKLKKIERFEPYTSFKESKYLEVVSKFDKKFIKLLKKNLVDYNYIKPTGFCPKIGFQQKEEQSLLSVKTMKTLGNYDLDNDPGGFCGAWVLYFLNLKMENPDVDSKQLLEIVYKYLENDHHSFRTFIRNYSSFIVNERSKILKKYNKNKVIGINSLLESKFSKMISRK
jgi:hypothetical protein